MSDKNYHGDGEDPLSQEIIRMFSEDQDIGGIDIEPLYCSINTDALDALFAGRDTDGQITFTHAGYRITVQRFGETRRIEIEEG